MRLSDDPLYVRPSTDDLRNLRQIGNALWRAWHAHLYTCRPCQQAKRCAEGQALLTAAESQPKAPSLSAALGVGDEAIDRPGAED